MLYKKKLAEGDISSPETSPQTGKRCYLKVLERKKLRGDMHFANVLVWVPPRADPETMILVQIVYTEGDPGMWVQTREMETGVKTIKMY